MDPLEWRRLGRTERRLGRTELRVTRLGCGAATLGDMRAPTPEAQAQETLAAAWEGGVRYFDTAPFYGYGKSEHRLGHFLRQQPRSEFRVSTKVGRVYRRPADPGAFPRGNWVGGLPFDVHIDYSRDGVLRSYEDSLQRLGLNRVDALLVHDLDPGFLGSEEAVQARLAELDGGGGFAALRELKEAAEVQAIGFGINRVGMVSRFLERFDPDFFLIAMPYTLLTQEALEEELPLCQERGLGVIIGAPFASGILAQAGGTYAYREPAPEVVEKRRRIQAVCDRFSVPLGAAALQFPLAHPCVASVIPGPNTPEQARQNLEWMRAEIPAEFWQSLVEEALVRPDAPLPVG